MVAGTGVIADLAGRNVLEPMATVSLKCRARVASSEMFSGNFWRAVRLHLLRQHFSTWLWS